MAARWLWTRARSLLVVAVTRVLKAAVQAYFTYGGVCLFPPRAAGSLRERALRGNSYEIIGLRCHGNKGCCSTTEK